MSCISNNNNKNDSNLEVWGRGGGGLVAQGLSNMLGYLRYGSSQAIVGPATLRQKLQIKLSISPK